MRSRPIGQQGDGSGVGIICTVGIGIIAPARRGIGDEDGDLQTSGAKLAQISLGFDHSTTHVAGAAHHIIERFVRSLRFKTAAARGQVIDGIGHIADGGCQRLVHFDRVAERDQTHPQVATRSGGRRRDNVIQPGFYIIDGRIHAAGVVHYQDHVHASAGRSLCRDHVPATYREIEC